MGDCPPEMGYIKPQTHGSMITNEYQPNVRSHVLRQNLSDDVSDTSTSNNTSTLNDPMASKRNSLASTSLSCAYTGKMQTILRYMPSNIIIIYCP